jgi:DNA polymerase elongation subunit (family B)
MSSLLLDIETFALDEAAEFIEDPTAPANYKDPEKIAAYIADAKAKAVSRCALDPDLCRIVAVGWEFENRSGTIAGGECYASETEERQGLREFWQIASASDRFIGFNLLAFDLPVLIRRSQYLGVDVPATVINLDRYRTPHVDLMERLTFNGKIKAHSLSFYCKRFGIDVEDDSTGADIDALVRAGQWDAVLAHCRADVQKTRLLAERLRLVQKIEAAA